MPENYDNKEHNHEDQWSNGSLDGEETHETKYTKITSCGRLLQCPGVGESFGIDLGVKDEEQIVAICKVD